VRVSELHRPQRVSRLAAYPWPPPPRTRTAHLHPALQPRTPAPRLALTRPEPAEIELSPSGDVHRRDHLGGLVHEYSRAAA